MFADGTIAEKRRANIMKLLNTLTFTYSGLQSEKSKLDKTLRFTARQIMSIFFQLSTIFFPYFGLLGHRHLYSTKDKLKRCVFMLSEKVLYFSTLFSFAPPTTQTPSGSQGKSITKERLGQLIACLSV